MNSYPTGWRRIESRMKNWRSLHYYTENMYTKFLLFFFQIFQSLFKVQQVSSSSVAGLCLFAKGEVKNLSKVDWTSLLFQNDFKVIQTLVFNQGTKSNVNNPVGLVGLPCAMWSDHFFVTHIQTDGKAKLMEWPDRSCLLFYVSARIHWTFVSRIHIR